MFSIFNKLSWFFKERWQSYLLAVVALVATAIMEAIIPLLVAGLIDAIIAGTLSQSYLTSRIGMILGMAVAMYALRYVWRNNIFGNSTRLEAIMRNRLYNHFTKMDQQFFDKYRTGDLMAHATNDLAALRFVAGGGVLTLVDSIAIGSITLLAMVFEIDWQLTLLTILPLPILAVVARKLGQLINQRYRVSLQAFSSMNDHVQESVAGVKVIKSFGEEEEDYQDFRAETENVVRRNIDVYRIDSAYGPIIELITGLTYVLALLFGTYFIGVGRLTIGQLVAFFSYLGQMAWPLLAAGRLVNTLERGNASYDRVTELMSERPDIQEVADPVTDSAFEHIQVDIDSFSYPDAEQETLQNIHFNLGEGDLLGLVGRTGSGKTTIFELLLRHYDIDQGFILIDGQDIKQFSLATLNDKIGYISQSSILFSTTVRDNIRFARPDMSQEEVEHYAKLADVHEDIMNFPNGYDTLVGEQGVTLSGGQRQRVSIARSLVLESPVLLIDDALSAVDAKTERKIIANLADHRKGKITIIATHRLSAVLNAQKTLVLKDGQVIERGNHQDLIALDGWYANIYDQQQLQQKLEGGE